MQEIAPVFAIWHHSFSIYGRYDLAGLMDKIDTIELKKLPTPLSPAQVNQKD